MPVTLIFNRIPHHSQHSGYDQLARYLAQRMAIDTLDDYMSDVVGGTAWTWLADKTTPWLARRAGMDWYDAYGFSLDVAGLWRSLRSRGRIFHHIYGENTYRFHGAGRFRSKGNRLVATYHQPPSVFDSVVRAKGAIDRLDAVVVVASNQASYFASLVGSDRVHVVPLGVDTDFFRPAEHGRSGEKWCLFVGRYLRDFEMLRAVAELVGRADPAVRFDAVVRGDDAGWFDGLPNVRTHSDVDEEQLLRLYQDSDLLVLPLRDATANCSLLEGLACGLPAVTTDVGGVRDYVDETCGCLVRPGDAGAMAEQVIELLGDAPRRSRLSQGSRTRALQYSWEHVVSQLVAVYEQTAS